MTHEKGIILVTGASGNVGRLVVDRLLEAGARVRALSARPERAALPPEVEVVRGFVGHVETVRPALEGVGKLYLAPHPPTAREVAALARAAGVEHVVDLAGEEGGYWHDIEGAVEEAGLDWTHLEPGEFMENAGDWGEQIRTRGEVRDAHPQARNAPIALADIAAVAAAALLDDRHRGRRYPLTGPESITRAQRVAWIGEALGREVPFVELAHEEAVADQALGVGEDVARWYLDRVAAFVEHPQRAAPTVEEVTGCPATPFARWARDNVHLFR